LAKSRCAWWNELSPYANVLCLSFDKVIPMRCKEIPKQKNRFLGIRFGDTKEVLQRYISVCPFALLMGDIQGPWFNSPAVRETKFLLTSIG
jgi:hypothetical protein